MYKCNRVMTSLNSEVIVEPLICIHSKSNFIHCFMYSLWLIPEWLYFIQIMLCLFFRATQRPVSHQGMSQSHSDLVWKQLINFISFNNFGFSFGDFEHRSKWGGFKSMCIKACSEMLIHSLCHGEQFCQKFPQISKEKKMFLRRFLGET